MAKPPMKQNQQMRITLFFALIIGVFILINLVSRTQEDPQQVKFSDFVASLSLPDTDQNKVTEVTFKENFLKFIF